MLPIQTALLSFGLSGRVFHAPFLHAGAGFRLAGVWERSRKEAAGIYPGIRSYDTLEELLADSSIELVVVNTPNYTHFEYARRALEAGKHVLVEKPFVVTAAEGEELQALATVRGLVLTVYHNRRWDSDLLTVKRVLAEGVLGELVEAAFHFDRYKPELSPKWHKEDPLPGTGALYDLGSHLIDGALHLFGMPERVFADIRTLRPGSKVDDWFELWLYYPMLRVRLHCSYYVRAAPPSFQLYGTQGSFLKPRGDVQEAELMAGRLPGSDAWGVEPPSAHGLLHGVRSGEATHGSEPSEAGDYGRYFTALHAAIREGAAPPVSAEDGIRVIRVIEAAFQSAGTGQAVNL